MDKENHRFNEWKKNIDEILASVVLPEIYRDRTDRDELIANAQIQKMKIEMRKLSMAKLLHSEELSYLHQVIIDIIKKYPQLANLYKN